MYTEFKHIHVHTLIKQTFNIRTHTLLYRTIKQVDYYYYIIPSEVTPLQAAHEVNREPLSLSPALPQHFRMRLST